MEDFDYLYHIIFNSSPAELQTLITAAEIPHRKLELTLSSENNPKLLELIFKKIDETPWTKHHLDIPPLTLIYRQWVASQAKLKPKNSDDSPAASLTVDLPPRFEIKDSKAKRRLVDPFNVLLS